MPICEVHLGWNRASNGKVDINIRLCGDIFEVDGSIVLVLWLAKVESELVVDGKVIETTLLDRVTKIVVLCVAFFTMVSGYTFCCAEAVSAPVVTQSALAVTLALATLATIYRMAKESLAAPLAMVALCVVFTRLLANTRGGAD